MKLVIIEGVGKQDTIKKYEDAETARKEAETKAISKLKSLKIPKRYLVNVTEVL